MANKIEVDIVTKISGNDAFNKIKKGLSDVVKGNTKVQESINKTSSTFGKIKNTVKNASSSASTALSGLKNRVNNSFPVKAVNQLNEKIRGLRGSSNSAGSALAGMVKKVAMIALSFVAISKGMDFAMSSVDEYKEALVNATKLQANMKVVKDYGGDPIRIAKATEALKSQANQLERIGVFDGDLITAGQAQLSTFQLTDKHINQLMPKIADVVANVKGLNATSEDFLNTSNMFGKSISTGLLAPLRKVGITMDDEIVEKFKKMSKDERVAALAQIMAENVGKVNEELAKTPLGRIQQAQNIWNNMKETVGEGVVKVMAQFNPIVAEITPHIETLAIKFGEFMDKIAGSGMIMDSFNMIKDTIKGIMDSFTNAGGLETINGIVSSLKETFSSVVDSAGKFFGALNMGTFAKGLLDGIKMVVDGIRVAFEFIKPILDPILEVVGEIFNALAPFIGPIAAIITAIMAIGPVIAAIMNPITWIIAAIIAVVMIFKNWDKIVKVVGDHFKTVFSAVANFFKAIWDGIKAYFMSLWEGLKMVVSFAIEGIKLYIQGLVFFWISVWEGIKFVVQFAWNVIKGYVQGAINNIKTVIQGIISGVSTVISSVKTSFQSGFNALIGIVQGVIDSIKNIIGGIVDKAKEVVDKVKAFFSKGFKTEVTVQENVVRGGSGKPGEKWTGTKNWKGGLTWVAERGRELINPPRGNPFVVNTPTLMDLGSGTEILNNFDTNKVLNSKIQEYKDKFNNSKIGSTINKFVGNKNESTDNSTTVNNNTSKQAPQVNINIQIIGDPGENQSSLISKIRDVVQDEFDNIFYKMLVKDGDISE